MDTWHTHTHTHTSTLPMRPMATWHASSILAGLVGAAEGSASRSLTVLLILAALPFYLFHGARATWHARRTVLLNLVLLLALGMLWFGPHGLWRAARRTYRLTGRIYRAAHVLFMEADDDGEL